MKKFIFLACLLVLMAATPALAQDNSSLISQLQEQIAKLSAQLSDLLKQNQSDFCYDFNRNISVGTQTDDATNLLRALIREKLADQDEVFQDGRQVLNYHEGYVPAVKKFQARYGIPQTGFVGALTRAKLNKLYGCGRNNPNSTITVLSPNGGEVWAAGSVQDIKWKMSNLKSGAKVDLYLDRDISCPADLVSKNGCGLWDPIPGTPISLDKNIDANSVYHWIVASEINSNNITIPSGQYRVRVCVAGFTTNCDSSDTQFTITNSVATGACYVGGCSAQLCSDQPNLASSCEYRAEYACYRNTGAKCERQPSGQCGWTPSLALTSCLANPPVLR
jgi:hypothetical protein